MHDDAAETPAARESNEASQELTYEAAAEAIGAIILAASALDEDVAFTHSTKDEKAELTLGRFAYSGTLVEVVREAGPPLKKRVADIKKRSMRADALLEKVPTCT